MRRTVRVGYQSYQIYLFNVVYRSKDVRADRWSAAAGKGCGVFTRMNRIYCLGQTGLRYVWESH